MPGNRTHLGVQHAALPQVCFEPRVTDAAKHPNVVSSSDRLKRDKIKLSFAKGCSAVSFNDFCKVQLSYKTTVLARRFWHGG